MYNCCVSWCEPAVEVPLSALSRDLLDHPQGFSRVPSSLPVVFVDCLFFSVINLFAAPYNCGCCGVINTALYHLIHTIVTKYVSK